MPVVVAHVCLHKRGLCCIVERLCERCDIRQITDHLFIYIIAQLAGAEIDIACIGKRAVFLLVTRERILVNGIDLTTINNLLAGTAQLHAIESIGFERACSQLVILLVECGVAVCNICCICATLVVGGVALVILLHLKVVVEVEHIHTCHITTVAVHTVFLHCGSLIYKCKHLVYLHIGGEGRFSIARYKRFVAPSLFNIFITGLHIAKYLYIVERVAHFGHAHLTGLHLNGR